MTESNDEQPEYTTDIRQIFSEKYTVSKRQLGIAVVILGILGFVGIAALDFVGGGREGGIGPAQSVALVLMGFVAVFGATLIPLGNDPA